MRRNTADVIRDLAAAAGPVQPLARPWTRAAIWCAASLPAIGVLYVVWPQPAASPPIDARFSVEQIAALVTGLFAAAAAFSTIVPGSSRWPLVAPLVPLGVWLATLGRMCARELSAAGHWPPILVHWACLPATIVTGAIPAIVIVAMLRRGAPISPRFTAGFAALAVAGISNVGARFIHPFDASVVALIWHVLAVLALSGAASPFGGRLFNWRTVREGSAASLS